MYDYLTYVPVRTVRVSSRQCPAGPRPRRRRRLPRTVARTIMHLFLRFAYILIIALRPIRHPDDGHVDFRLLLVRFPPAEHHGLLLLLQRSAKMRTSRVLPGVCSSGTSTLSSSTTPCIDNSPMSMAQCPCTSSIMSFSTCRNGHEFVIAPMGS